MPQASPDFTASPDIVSSLDFSSSADFASNLMRCAEPDTRSIDYEALADALTPIISALIEREVRQRSML